MQMRKLATRIVRSQAGFTLAELLVVVGIIVGLAAVILPNIGRFTGSGATGASAAEYQSVQTAMDTWRADTATTVAGTSGSNASQDVLTGAVDNVNLTGYLRLPGGATLTGDFYCWDSDGTVTQYATAALCP